MSSKAVSRDKALEASARVATQVNWDKIDGGNIQEDVISLPPEKFGRRFTAFFKNGARFILGDLKVATIPFDPVKFIGAGWAFWKGPEYGDGLEGEEDRDKVSADLTEVNFDKVEFLTCLEEGESSIAGEEKLARLKESGRILYGATVFAGLWHNHQMYKNKAESVLEKLYQKKRITHIDFFGDILFRNQDGRRCVLRLRRRPVGQWLWGFLWLNLDLNNQDFSVVSKQVK